MGKPIEGTSVYATKADAKLAAARKKQHEAESRADAADRRTERLEAVLERISERLFAIERRLDQRVRPVQKPGRSSVFGVLHEARGSARDDHLHHWTAIADHLGVKPDAARHLAKTQGLPVFRLGRTVAASRAKIEVWRQTCAGFANQEGA